MLRHRLTSNPLFNLQMQLRKAFNLIHSVTDARPPTCCTDTQLASQTAIVNFTHNQFQCVKNQARGMPASNSFGTLLSLGPVPPHLSRPCQHAKHKQELQAAVRATFIQQGGGSPVKMAMAQLPTTYCIQYVTDVMIMHCTLGKHPLSKGRPSA